MRRKVAIPGRKAAIDGVKLSLCVDHGRSNNVELIDDPGHDHRKRAKILERRDGIYGRRCLV